MNFVYILSGPPRTAKTTIMRSLVAKTRVQLVTADAITHGLRNILTGQPHQMLRRVEIRGIAEHKSSITEGGERKPFVNQGTESELLREAAAGMLDYYGRNGESVAFEGSDFPPAWVSSLDLPGFAVRAAYVGYTNASHADAILSYARTNGQDWINDWIASEGGDDTKIQTWVQDQVEKSKLLKSDAESHGYQFFDISTQPFETYKSAVLDQLLQI